MEVYRVTPAVYPITGHVMSWVLLLVPRYKLAVEATRSTWVLLQTVLQMFQGLILLFQKIKFKAIINRSIRFIYRCLSHSGGLSNVPT